MRRRPALAALAVAAVGAGVLAGPASAAFPGLNGRIVFERNSQIMIKDPGVAAVATAITNTGQNSDPTWSPDGLRIAFASDRNGGTFQIWTMDAAGGNLVQRTFDAGDKSTPSWSPDATRLAYTVNNGTDDDVAVASLTPAPSLTVAGGAGDQRGPVWTPDGGRILFQDVSDSLSIVGATGAGRTPFLSDAIQPDYSPDGSRIVVTRTSQIPFIVNADGTGTTNLPSGQPAARPVWSPDGTVLLFQRTGGTPNGLWRLPSAGGTATRETPGPALDFGADWQPIGAVPAIGGLAVGPTLIVTGSGFAFRSVVRWNGADRATTWISPTRLHAQLSAADLAPGSAQVTVFTSPSGGGLSAPATAVIPGPPPPPPKISLTRARLAKVSWSASRVSGRLVLNGALERAGRVEIALVRGSRVAQRRVLNLPAAPFALQIPLAAGLLPGRYTVRVSEPAPPAGAAALATVTGTVAIAAPPEGVSRTSFVSALQNGPPARTLRGKSRIYATFRLAALPKKGGGRQLTTRWFGPGGVSTDRTGKPRRALVTSFVSLRGGLPAGTWRCELRAGKTLVAVARVRLR